MELFLAGVVLGGLGLLVLTEKPAGDKYEPVYFKKKPKDEKK